jgi:hypothetical protein
VIPAPACSAPPAFPAAALPRSSASSSSPYGSSPQPSSFAALLHQASDDAGADAGADADSSGKDALEKPGTCGDSRASWIFSSGSVAETAMSNTQDQDKSVKQPALAAPSPAPVPVAPKTVTTIAVFLTGSGTAGKPEKSTGPVEDDDARPKSSSQLQPPPSQPQASDSMPAPAVQQTVAPAAGFLAWSSTTGRSEKSTGPAEDNANAAPADETKPDATASTAGATLLMQAIAGLGIPQFTPPLLGPQASQQPAPERQHANKQAGEPDRRVDAPVGVAAPAAGLATSTSAPAIAAADDASLSLSLNTDGSGTGGNAGTLLPTTPSEGDGKAPLSSGQLAFAARLSADTPSAQPSAQVQAQATHPQAAPASSPAPESDAIQPPAAVVPVGQSGPEQSGERAQKSDDQALSAPSAAAGQAGALRSDAAHTLAQPADIRSADVDQTPAAGANATAVRDVRLQVAGNDNQRVDVRVMDRGGELRVSVRADDPSLVRSLQDNVADLSSRLDQARFRSEVWTPRAEAVSQTDSASTNGRTFSNRGEAFGRDGQGQQQNGRQQQQPSWVDDFDENPAGRNSGGTPQWQP